MRVKKIAGKSYGYFISIISMDLADCRQVEFRLTKNL